MTPRVVGEDKDPTRAGNPIERDGGLRGPLRLQRNWAPPEMAGLGIEGIESGAGVRRTWNRLILRSYEDRAASDQGI